MKIFQIKHFNFHYLLIILTRIEQFKATIPLYDYPILIIGNNSQICYFYRQCYKYIVEKKSSGNWNNGYCLTYIHGFNDSVSMILHCCLIQVFKRLVVIDAVILIKVL